MDDVIHCPPAGKRVRIAESAAETGGEYVQFEMWLDPESRGPYLHVHPHQDETLAVVTGRLGVHVDGETTVLDEGEQIDIPRGVRHQFWNDADDETHILGDLQPGRRTDEFLPLAFALARDRWATRAGVPLNLLAVAAVFDEYEDYYYFAYVPVSVQKLGIRALAPIARRLGYDARLDGGPTPSQESAD